MTREVDAAKNADWVQVVLNGGPPCFHLEDGGRFCLRAERWDGHREPGIVIHPFKPLADLILEVQRQTAEKCAEIADTCHDEKAHRLYGGSRDAAICREFGLEPR